MSVDGGIHKNTKQYFYCIMLLCRDFHDKLLLGVRGLLTNRATVKATNAPSNDIS